MKQFYFLLIASTLLIFSCQPKRTIIFPATDLAEAAIIPQPLSIQADGSGFALDQFTEITVDANDNAYQGVADYLINKLEKKTALSFKTETRHYNHLIIQQVEETDDPEAYTIKISQDSLLLTSGTAAGAFRGVQTVRQLIPENSNDTLTTNPVWVIPTGTINDAPQFEFRSTMLDVARHFFSVEDVKTYLDILAYYKINKFHMHLSDDQGWRIEIKSWPLLTEVGSTTGVGGGPGGFYTQEDYKEIVSYAAERFITVIPEIDMPGHTNSASLAYPFLNGNGKEVKIETNMAVGYSTFDTRKDTVYAFIDDVVREISALTPGPYFHIGGDESLVTKEADYKYFVERVEKIVEKHGKRMIGWDEIATTNMSSSSVAQWWNNKDNAQQGIDQGMKLIVSLAQKAYLDMRYNKDSEYGLGWAGEIPVDVAYNWYPEDYFDNQHILGVETPLWSETIRTLDELEYLAFPRVIGYAELGWSIKENRDWEDYKRRLIHHGKFLRAEGVDYYASPKIDWGY